MIPTPLIEILRADIRGPRGPYKKAVLQVRALVHHSVRGPLGLTVFVCSHRLEAFESLRYASVSCAKVQIPADATAADCCKHAAHKFPFNQVGCDFEPKQGRGRCTFFVVSSSLLTAVPDHQARKLDLGQGCSKLG